MSNQLELSLAERVGIDDVTDATTRSPDERELSPEQLAVVQFEDDLVVTAGAGSGKTRTLVELYANLVESPESIPIADDDFGPERILCLTFTERAAREIKERIREVISDPEDRRQLETAPISTFHAFCAGVLRRHPLEANIDPGFSVLSDDVAQELLMRVAVETLHRGVKGGDLAARQAVKQLGLARAGERLADLVQAIRTAGWELRQPIVRFEEQLERIAAAIEHDLPQAIATTVETLVTAAHVANLKSPKAKYYLKTIENIYTEWSKDPTPSHEESLDQACKAPAHSWRFENATELRHTAHDAITLLRGARSELEHQAELGCWPALAVSIRAAYRDARLSRRVLDYDDLLLRTRDLLISHSEVQRHYSERFRAVLVDEHQDTDPVQQEILTLLIGADTLAGQSVEGAPRWCVVGDAKQAIYGFRGARVEAYRKLAIDADQRRALKILRSNYRCRPDLVAFHNAFFPAVLDPETHAGQAPYEEQVAHREPSGRPAVEFIRPSDQTEDDKKKPAVSHREHEARALAMRLKAACDPAAAEAIQVQDPANGETRLATPGDIAVLLRRMTDVEPYRHALQAVGLESVVVGSGSFYGRQEVYDCLNAIEAALTPADPIPLIAFLRSPMAGLTDDALYRLARDWERRSGLPLRDHVFASPGSVLSNEELAVIEDAKSTLDELASRADTEPPGDTLAWLLDRTGYPAIVDALPDRAQRRANLRRLVSVADRAPRDGIKLLAEFAAGLRRRTNVPPRERDAPLPDAGNRAVIMSIHQAKGLEFPIVAVADIGSKSHFGIDKVAFDPKLGIVAQRWDDALGDWTPTLSHERAKERAKERDAAEEARLLYVASTRARDHLIFSAGVKGNVWLELVETFSQRDDSGLVTPSQSEWADRFATAAAVESDLPDPGRSYLEPLPTAPGDTTAREVAALLAGMPADAGPRGTAAHDAMRAARWRGLVGHESLQRVPLDPPTEFDLKGWLNRVVGVDADDIPTLAGFIEDHVQPVLGTAQQVEREHSFRLRLPDAGTVVGMIDCLWQNGGGQWWVWDYKFGGPNPDLDRFHDAQLAVYALAAAAALDLERVNGRVWHVDGSEHRDLEWDRDALAELERRIADVLATRSNTA
jgi:ATP-dependent exoDNAse (exonuclease V) beta subunit